jgi:hypothetical protein
VYVQRIIVSTQLFTKDSVAPSVSSNSRRNLRDIRVVECRHTWQKNETQVSRGCPKSV